MTLLSPLGTALQTLGLALAIGGMLALGAFTAPVLFKTFARPEAGAAMTVIFRRYDTVLLVATGLVLAGEGLRFVAAGFASSGGLLPLVRYGLIAGFTALVLYSTLTLNPQIEALQRGNIHDSVEELRRFRNVHTLSENLYKIELLLAVLLLVLTPFSPPKSP